MSLIQKPIILHELVIAGQPILTMIKPNGHHEKSLVTSVETSGDNNSAF